MFWAILGQRSWYGVSVGWGRSASAGDVTTYLCGGAGGSVPGAVGRGVGVSVAAAAAWGEILMVGGVVRGEAKRSD